MYNAQGLVAPELASVDSALAPCRNQGSKWGWGCRWAPAALGGISARTGVGEGHIGKTSLVRILDWVHRGPIGAEAKAISVEPDGAAEPECPLEWWAHSKINHLAS
ncbi:hypothetical protein NDU88_004261 [Pleurodeles waltl]|uniref:Uncharacterized protein n=1 Tax=Pleurodeles waltl TaxID=8319 RepID=A0AAV7UGM3_PLEWA|nr:hypothetical protein NDU88_004261 [Pleurodeles waltl]